MILKQLSSIYNPFYVDVNGKFFQVSNIAFFDESGVIASVGRGWFGSNNHIKEIENEITVIKKVKVDFSCKSAFIIKDNENTWKSETVYILYIPSTLAGLEVVKVDKWMNTQIITYYKTSLHKKAVFDVCTKVIDSNLHAIRKEMEEITKEMQSLYDVKKVLAMPEK